jgi:ABC-type sugar transport system, periplasmic component
MVRNDKKWVPRDISLGGVRGGAPRAFIKPLKAFMINKKGDTFMKKWLSLVLAMTMLLSVSAAALAEATEATYPIVTEPLTLKAFQYQLENQQVDFDNLWFFTELEKKTGIHIEFEPVKDGDWKLKRNFMYADGNYPDIILRGDPDAEEYGVQQGVLIPLEDLIPQYMPNYYSRLNMNNANAAIPSSDGHTYYIGNLTAQNVNHEANFFINKAWLDALNLEVPTTVEELTEVLRKFKTGDPNGNGEADEVPMIAADLIHQTQGVYTHFAMFGVPLSRFVYANVDDDNNVYFPGYLPGFRAAVEWLHQMYEEGILDPESLTQDSNVWGTKMNSGVNGFTTYLRLINSALSAETAAQFVSIIPPAAEGYKAITPRILEVPTYGAALTIANQHVPETLRWLDAQFETETMLESVNGPIGGDAPIEDTMEINAEGKYVVKYIPENNGLYEVVPVYHGQFFAPGDYYFDVFDMPPHRVERANYSAEYEAAGVLEKNSFEYLYKLVKPTPDETEELALLFTALENFMKESITSFIVNGVTDDSYNTFLETAKNVGADRYVEIYQGAYDKYLEAQK